jgi:hypothetical protein
MTDLFFVEDEELDFETILSAPLPKVPLDVTYTGTNIEGDIWAFCSIIIGTNARD